MTAVPTRSTAHRALAHWDETGGYLPHAACAWVRVSMHPCTSIRTLPHIMIQCWWPLPKLSVQGTSKAASNLGRPRTLVNNNSTGAEAGQGQVNKQCTSHSCRTQIKSNPVESSRAIGHRVPRRPRRTEHTNQTPSPPRQVSTSPVVPRSGLPTIDGSPNCSSSRPCHSSLNARQVCC